MSTADRVRGRRVGLSRRVRATSRYFTLSLILHVVVIAAALLLFGKPPDEAPPIEVTLIVDSGNETAGKLEGEKAEEAESSPQQQAAPQPTAPRPNPKPKAPPVKAVPAPAKAAPVVRPVSTPPADPVPVVEQAPTQQTSPVASRRADTGQAESGAATGTGTANGTGAGQPASAAPGSGSGGGGAGKASGGGSKGRGAGDYLERVRAALARHKRYPEQARKLKQEGTVSISLHIARDGTVLAAQIAQGSGFALLDEAALQMARDASPVPRVPDEVDGESVRIALPISYSLGFFGRF